MRRPPARTRELDQSHALEPWATRAAEVLRRSAHLSPSDLDDGSQAYAGASIEVTRTSFLFTNSCIPRLESSRP